MLVYIDNYRFGIYPSDDGSDDWCFRGDECFLNGQDGPADHWIEAIDKKYADTDDPE